jgi:hypothetical protein
MARYDFGLRGPRDTMGPRFTERDRRGYEMEYRDRPPRMAGPNRVTERYNMDYLQPRGERYPINPFPFGGDSYDRIGDERAYRRPFTTRAGTRTSRGASPSMRYDYRDFGPEYGGRYPDEL